MGEPRQSSDPDRPSAKRPPLGSASRGARPCEDRLTARVWERAATAATRDALFSSLRVRRRKRAFHVQRALTAHRRASRALTAS